MYDLSEIFSKAKGKGRECGGGIERGSLDGELVGGGHGCLG